MEIYPVMAEIIMKEDVSDVEKLTRDPIALLASFSGKYYGRRRLERKKMKSKFKLGNIFTKKYARDTIPLEIYEIIYSPIEPVYKLKQIRLCDNNIILGEEALIELYNKIN